MQLKTDFFIDTGVRSTLWLNTKGLTKCKDVRYGIFYNSYDKKRHIAPYIPDKTSPRRILCNAIGGDFNGFNMTVTRSSDNLCTECLLHVLDHIRRKVQFTIQNFYLFEK